MKNSDETSVQFNTPKGGQPNNGQKRCSLVTGCDAILLCQRVIDKFRVIDEAIDFRLTVEAHDRIGGAWPCNKKRLTPGCGGRSTPIGSIAIDTGASRRG